MKLSLYPGDTTHTVRIERGKSIVVKREVVKRSSTRMHYWAGIMFNADRTTSFQSAANNNDFEGYPDPSVCTIVVLVRRPWYNHLRALLG